MRQDPISPIPIYITTAIDYVNGAPHLGHALEKVQADALARYFRARGTRVLFITGTDEHGAKIVRAARAADMLPQEFVDQNAEKFRALKKALNLSWDDFIRTTDHARHWPGAQKMWSKLMETGDIYKKTYKGLYCIGHEAFVTEKDLVDGLCRDHQKAPEIVEEENYFFRLSKYTGMIELRIKNDELRIVPETRKNEILSLIEHEGLDDVSFSRPRKDLAWGIPVPNDDAHTMYVWADALVNYISAIGYGTDEARFNSFWPATYQVIGKDILRFHAAIWPGMLLAAGLPLPKSLLVHGHMTVDGQKMSKSIGNVIDPFELTKKYGTDAVRYYLLKEIPSGEDGDFSISKFEALYNGDLANGVGNFAARVLALAEKAGDIAAHTNVDPEIQKSIDTARSSVTKQIEAFRLNEALVSLWQLIASGDTYVNEKKVWAIEDSAEKNKVIVTLVTLLGTIAELLNPFLPETASKIAANIHWEGEVLKVQKGGNLFPRIEGVAK